MEELSSLACRVICFLTRSLLTLSDYPSSGSTTTHRPLPLTRNIAPHPLSGPSTSSSTQIGGSDNKLQETGKILSKIFESLHKQLEKLPFQSRTRSLSCSASVQGACGASIDILPDDVLLQIFDFYQMDRTCPLSLLEWCHPLLVCRRWRQLIISSPRQLNLYIWCTVGKPFRKYLDLLPTFPLVIYYDRGFNYITKQWSPGDEEDILAALEHPNRISSLNLHVTRLLLEKVAHQQFPILTQLSLSSREDVSALPNEFLGGCAPRLQTLFLGGIPFPTLPTLLSSATDLVSLDLRSIPHTGYISPVAMVAGLAALTRLEALCITFQSSTSRPDHSDTSSWAALPTQAVLPALTSFSFKGTGEYLEDLVARVEAPRLHYITITYLKQHIFHVPQLFKFVGQFQVLEDEDKKTVSVYFERGERDIHFQLDVENGGREDFLNIDASGQSSDWQDSALASTLRRRYSAVLSGVVNLSFHVLDWHPYQHGDSMVNNYGWLQILRQCTALETLFVSDPLAGYIAGALEHDAEFSNIWPALHLLCLEDQPPRRVEKFVMARQRSDHPVTVVSERDEFRDLHPEPHRFRHDGFFG